LELVLLEKDCDKVARLLLMWGANVSERHMTLIRNLCPESATLLDLSTNEYGGRRCEVVGLQNNIKLNGKIGVATQYLPKKDRYVFQLLDEPNARPVQIRPVNLKRRDYTIEDN
jgi:hypothetical protein